MTLLPFPSDGWRPRRTIRADRLPLTGTCIWIHDANTPGIIDITPNEPLDLDRERTRFAAWDERQAALRVRYPDTRTERERQDYLDGRRLAQFLPRIMLSFDGSRMDDRIVTLLADPGAIWHLPENPAPFRSWDAPPRRRP